ncbi:unnamed protein product, partial [marine sediment metagenome]
VKVARMRRSVLLISPLKHLGGLTSNGLGATDIGNKTAIGGMSREFYQRLFDYYFPDSSGSQWRFEPHVAEKTDYYASIGYLNEEGFIIESDLTRFTGRANVNFQATDWLKTGFNVNVANRKSNWAQTGSSTTFVNPIRFTRGIGSIYPIHQIDPATGQYILDDYGKKQFDIYDHRAGGASTGRHVPAEIRWDEDMDETSTLGGKTYVEITFLKDFKFTTNASMDQRFYYNTHYNNPLICDGAPGGRAYRTYNKRNSVNINQLLNYGKVFDNHNFNVILGHESYEYKYNRLRGART